MGDIADMILEGILDEETGEYIGDHNKKKYGTEAPGFPVSLNRESVTCDICNKRLKSAKGMLQHKRDKHNS